MSPPRTILTSRTSMLFGVRCFFVVFAVGALAYRYLYLCADRFQVSIFFNTQFSTLRAISYSQPGYHFHHMENWER